MDEKEFYVLEYIYLLWNKRLLFILITSIFAVLSVIYSLMLPNIYKSSVILAPVSTNQSLSNKINTISSFAGVAGFNLPSGEMTKSEEAIERIKSFTFFEESFLPNIKLENLMAVKMWNRNDNTITYYEDLYDANNKKWVRNVSFPKKSKPSQQEAFKIYRDILEITENNKSSFIKISIKHKSPEIAKKWVETISKTIDERMRLIDKKNALDSVEFLQNYSVSNNIQSVSDSISNLLEIQMKTLMLTSSSDDYIFKIIDYPIVSEYKYEPNRALLCILGTILGGILSIFIILIHNFITTNKELFFYDKTK